LWLRLTFALLALTLQLSFPAISSRTLREPYGNPVSETFQVRPGVAATAQYGMSAELCYVIVNAKTPPSFGPTTVDSQLLKDIEDIVDELVPIPRARRV
jgi:hypothetical protein